MKPEVRQHPGRARSWVVGLGLAAVLGAGLALRGGSEPPSEPKQPSSSSTPVKAAAAPSPQATRPLRIVRLTASPLDVAIGSRSVLDCQVEGGRTGALRYSWVAAKGRMEPGSGSTASWVAPKTPGIYQVGVLVEDGESQVKQTVMLHVHVPTPEDLLALMRGGDWAEAQERAKATQQEVEARLGSLREVVAKRETREDRLRAFFALEDLATELLGEGRYEEALQSYEELLGSLLETDPKRKRYLAGKASALFALGREEEALRAYAEAGDYNHPMSHYYAGLLLEARGQLPEALEAYRQASESNRWFADPLLRYAQLLLRLGRPTEEVMELLVTASPRFGRDVMLERLATDAQFALLNQALTASGRAVELEDQRPIEESLPEPPKPPEPGQGAVIVRQD